MNEQESVGAAISEEIHLESSDPRWPAMYCFEQDRIVAALPGAFLELQHIGSTAVPGLAAKPIIDILAGVETMDAARSLAEPVCRFGYTTSTEFNASLTDRQWFMRSAQGRRTHHLHVVVWGGPVWHARLRFRDALRADSGLARDYAKLKLYLAKEYASDREAYTAAKSDFVQAVLSKS